MFIAKPKKPTVQECVSVFLHMLVTSQNHKHMGDIVTFGQYFENHMEIQMEIIASSPLAWSCPITNMYMIAVLLT